MVVEKADTDAFIYLMEKASKYGLLTDTFKKPSHKDQMWVPKENILTNAGQSVGIGKTKRLMRITPEDAHKIEYAFTRWVQKYNARDRPLVKAITDICHQYVTIISE